LRTLYGLIKIKHIRALTGKDFADGAGMLCEAALGGRDSMLVQPITVVRFGSTPFKR
jgi:hypothetical protein